MRRPRFPMMIASSHSWWNSRSGLSLGTTIASPAPIIDEFAFMKKPAASAVTPPGVAYERPHLLVMVPEVAGKGQQLVGPRIRRLQLHGRERPAAPAGDGGFDLRAQRSPVGDHAHDTDRRPLLRIDPAGRTHVVDLVVLHDADAAFVKACDLHVHLRTLTIVSNRPGASRRRP